MDENENVEPIEETQEVEQPEENNDFNNDTNDITDDTNEIRNDEIEPSDESSEESSETELSEEEINSLKGDVDETGVSKYNRLKEAQRKQLKAEKEAEQLRTQQSQKQEPTNQPTYTKEQLAQFYENTQDEGHKTWAANEYKRMEKKEIVDEVMSNVHKHEQAKNFKAGRDQAVSIVQQSYPEMFSKNKDGTFGDWNYKSPLFNKMRQYYFADPLISRHPSGLIASAKMAAADLGRGRIQQQYNQNQDLKKEIKSLQKGTLIEGAGKTDIRIGNPIRDSINRGRSGKVKDNSDAMKSILGRSGVIKN